MTDRKNLMIKTGVPVLIIIAIFAMWFLKNNQNNGNVALAETQEDNLDFALHVTEELDLEQLKSYGLPIIIDFGADSCIPCKEMAPVLVQLNAEFQGQAIIKFVDVWKYQELSAGYPLRVIPTQIFFDKDGNPYVPADPEGNGMLLYSSKENGEHVFTAHEGGMTEEMLLNALAEMGVTR